MNEENVKWITTDMKQLNWLLKYLKTRIILSGFPPTTSTALRAQLIYDLESAFSGLELVEFLRRTRASWKQFERRSKLKKSHKTLTIEIDNEIYKRVKGIARKANCPINEAIEELLKSSCNSAESALAKRPAKRHSRRYS